MDMREDPEGMEDEDEEIIIPVQLPNTKKGKITVKVDVYDWNGKLINVWVTQDPDEIATIFQHNRSLLDN